MNVTHCNLAYLVTECVFCPVIIKTTVIIIIIIIIIILEYFSHGINCHVFKGENLSEQIDATAKHSGPNKVLDTVIQKKT